MTRFLPLLLLCCHTDRLTSIEAEAARLREQVEERAARLVEVEKALVEHEKRIRQASTLAALGGPKRRYTGGISCDGSAYLAGSYGAEAHAALFSTGLCDPPDPLPVPKLAVRE